MEKPRSKFDIRHKETLTLFLPEYFKLFFPDLADKIRFDTAKFLDKELMALFEQPGEKKKDQQRITDALILVQIVIDGKTQWILIHWEHMGRKPPTYEKKMFHYFCGIYFKFQKLIFPIAMFTDNAKWKKPVKDVFKISLGDYKINEFTYRLIKLKNYTAEEFEKKIAVNPLAAAYLPLTYYKKSERPVIKAKALNGIAQAEEGPKRSVLFSLVNESIRLNPDEEEEFNQLIHTDTMYKEAKMLQSIEEVGYERGWEGGREEGQEETIEKMAKTLLNKGWLSKEKIMELTGLNLKKINALEKETKYIQ